MIPARWAGAALAALGPAALLADVSATHAATPATAVTVPDTAALTNGDRTVGFTITLTCEAGHTGYGSVAVSDNANAADLGQPQAYSGVLTVPCTGQPVDLPLAMVTTGTPFREGPALFRAGFTINLCDDTGCRYVSIAKPITLARPAAAQFRPAPAAPPAPSRTAPGEGRP